MALREGWRLAQLSGDLLAFDDAANSDQPPAGAPASTPSAADLALERLEHEQRVADLATLKPRERRELYLKALGYRYEEIDELTGSSFTAVNRRLAEGRAQLRQLAQDRDTRQP